MHDTSKWGGKANARASEPLSWYNLAMTSSRLIASGHAPGKIILFGEHAVVYGRPAIAAPVQQVQAHAEIYPHRRCQIQAADLGRVIVVAEAPDDDPFARIVRLVCAELERPLPRWRIVVRSEIPIAAGLGSGAAIAAAIARGMAAAFGEELSRERLSALVYEVEKLHHGAPSGIDNTVVAYEQPVWFVRGREPQPFAVGESLHLLVADTGVASPTRVTVGAVRRAWEGDPLRYEAMFDAVGAIATAARGAIAAGDAAALGLLMDENQRLLAAMNVSSPELERLIFAARNAGALGAKLSGGGGGGNMIALARAAAVERVGQALRAAGATRVIRTAIHLPAPRGRRLKSG